MTIKIVFNDAKISVENSLTIANFLEKKYESGTTFAVAINHTFVPRSRYELTHLNDNDIVDIITPMQGG